MITLFPIAFWSKKNMGTRSGTSWFFVCTATRGHPNAAAIMPQEIYETRYKTVRAVAIGAILAGIGVQIGWAFGRTPTALDVTGLGAFGLAVGMLFAGLFLPWQREMEFRGQAITAVLREQIYGFDIEAAAQKAALMLEFKYDQFGGWKADRLAGEILSRTAWAKRWAQANRGMIERVKKGATQS